LLVVGLNVVLDDDVVMDYVDRLLRYGRRTNG
jgi:hypothetical protein